MAPKRGRTPSSPQTSSSSHLYLLTQSQDPVEVDQPRRDDEDGDTDNGDDGEPIKKRARVRREWASGDEITILEAVADYRRKHKKLPERTDNIFFEELAQRLQDRTRQPAQVKDKVKSLERRYFSAAAHRATSDSSHGERLNEISAEIWGVLTHDGAAAASRDHDDNNGGDRPAAMGDMYPLVAQKVDALASVQPAARTLFQLLDYRQVGLMEKQLEEIGWSEMGVERSLEKMLRKASKKKASKKK